MIMGNKVGLIIGIANEKSIAYGIAKSCYEQGAKLCFSYLNDSIKKRVEPIAKELGNGICYELDIINEDNLSSMINKIKQDFGKIDFILHSVAFAPKSALCGNITDTSKEDFNITMQTSVFSLISLAKYSKEILNKNGSILTLTYLGGDRVVPNYNIMGVAKSALDSSVRYLAYELGKDDIRINAISAGPVKTLAASAIGDFKKMLNYTEENSPLRRNITLEDVGNSGMYLLSDLSNGVTGEIHFVDCGYNILGVPNL